ncbi:MAG TPA: tail fiber domain-containing protein [Leptospiraceae bacterium]|nr:tail fiber domain-containing protein [Leptospiraceae bacterium]
MDDSRAVTSAPLCDARSGEGCRRRGEVLSGLKRGISIGIGFVLTLGVSAVLAVAVTGTINTYTTGAVMDAASLNTNFASLKTAIESIPNWKSSGTSAYYTDGNVGIGTNSPTAKFQVFAASNSSISIVPTSSGSGKIDMYADNQPNFKTIFNYTANSVGGSQDWTGMTAHPFSMGLVFGTGDGTGGMNSMPTVTPLMVIKPSGNVGISTTNPSYRLDVSDAASNIVFRLTGLNGACTHAPQAGSETVACSSDEKLKTDIRDAAPVLEDLLHLKIRDYTIRNSRTKTTGVIAQEVQKSSPELVHPEKDGTLMVDQISTWKLVKAIQEISLRLRRATDSLETEKSRNQKLETVNNALQEKMLSMEKRLQAIEKMQSSAITRRQL